MSDSGLTAWMRRIAETLPQAYGASGELKFVRAYPPLVNWEKETAFAAGVAREVFGDERVHVEAHLPSAYQLAVELAEEALAEVGVQSGSGVLITGSVVTAGEARAMFGKDPQ